MSSTPLQNCSSVLHPCHATTTILTQSLKLLALLPSHGFWALLKKITTLLMLFKSHSCLQPQRGPRTASQSFFFLFLLPTIFSFSLVTFHNWHHFNLPYSIPNPPVLSKQPHFLIKRQYFGHQIQSHTCFPQCISHSTGKFDHDFFHSFPLITLTIMRMILNATL